MTFKDLDGELRAAIGDEALAQLDVLPETLTDRIVRRIADLASIDRAKALEMCGSLGTAAVGAVSLTADTALPVALLALLTKARTHSTSTGFLAEIADSATRMGIAQAQVDGGDGGMVAMVANADTGAVDEPASMAQVAAVYLALIEGLACAACALLQLTADGYDDDHEGEQSGLLDAIASDPDIDGDPERITPRALLMMASSRYRGDEEERERFTKVVDRYREQLAAARRETMEAQLMRYLDDLPTTGEDDQR